MTPARPDPKTNFLLRLLAYQLSVVSGALDPASRRKTRAFFWTVGSDPGNETLLRARGGGYCVVVVEVVGALAHGIRAACCLCVSVVNQRYDPEVQYPGGFLGNNVLMRCNVPSFVRDHVTITSWLQEPSFNIYPSTMGGE